MNKKGFTLVEVLGVIVVLGVIGLIAGKMFTKNVDEAVKTISDSQKNSILNAAEKWSVENTGLLDDTAAIASRVAGTITGENNQENITRCVTTDYLYKEGYINTKDIKIENNEKFSGYVIIDWDDTTSQYKFRFANTEEEINSCKNHLVTNE